MTSEVVITLGVVLEIVSQGRTDFNPVAEPPGY